MTGVVANYVGLCIDSDSVIFHNVSRYINMLLFANSKGVC
jgi:hypothetical protein